MASNVKAEPSREEDFALFNLTDVDRATLLQIDEEFVPHDWAELKTIIANNDLHLFKRSPTQLRRYLTWSRETKSQHGSIVAFVRQERLHWSSSSSSSSPPAHTIKPVNPTPFANPTDYKILRNDWPYGVEPDIAHLVVWLKTAFCTDAEGHVLPESRKIIGEFVQEKFGERLRGKYADAGDRVLWFKNWSALQSVGALEHFHVFVRGAGENLLREWTGEGPREMM